MNGEARPLQFPEDVKLGQLTTFLKVVHAIGGKANLSEVSRELHSDLVMLPHILDAAEMLQLATVEKGKVMLSKRGEELLARGGSEFNVIKDSLRDIEPFRTALSLKRFNAERIADELARRGIRWHHEGILNTAIVNEILIHWGITAGLLDYDGNESIFTVRLAH